ncbi:MAG: hypothetical protein VX564_05390, partial [Nitrospirota bacterium]|nr:hypothetical protein [Nitrospirota bacterium]
MQLFTFRPWFNSATTVFLCFLPVFSSWAQDNGSIEQLEEVVVSDTRLPSHAIRRHEIAAKITVITAKEISESG